MKYTSFGPYVQLSWDIGPVTLSGGLRYEDGRVKVDDYTTTYFRNRRAVTGGTLKYTNTLPNVGAIARLGGGFSVFGSYSKGFTLPNVGIPLRNVSTPGQSVDGILDLKAVIFDNKEVARTGVAAGAASVGPITIRSRNSAPAWGSIQRRSISC